MSKKNAAEMQQNTENVEGVKHYSTMNCSQPLAPHWCGVAAARIASPHGLAEVTPGLAAMVEPGEYLVAVRPKTFLVGAEVADLVAELELTDGCIDVWMTDSICDCSRKGRVRREVRGSTQRLKIEDGVAQWQDEPRDVFCAVTISERDLARFDICPTTDALVEVPRVTSKSCQRARELRAQHGVPHGYSRSMGATARTSSGAVAIGGFI